MLFFRKMAKNYYQFLLQDECKTLRARAKQSNIHNYYYLRLSVGNKEV